MIKLSENMLDIESGNFYQDSSYRSSCKIIKQLNQDE